MENKSSCLSISLEEFHQFPMMVKTIKKQWLGDIEVFLEILKTNPRISIQTKRIGTWTLGGVPHSWKWWTNVPMRGLIIAQEQANYAILEILQPGLSVAFDSYITSIVGSESWRFGKTVNWASSPCWKSFLRWVRNRNSYCGSIVYLGIAQGFQQKGHLSFQKATILKIHEYRNALQRR